ncbi:hypothetical protein D3Z56_30810, partial [Lachnospiraceae bacterium]|nr:hypothetical protein [Lachnospiraceae bacterium]
SRNDEGRGGESKASHLGSIGAFLSKLLQRASQSCGGGFDAEGLAEALGRAELEAGAAAPGNLGGLHEGGCGLQR